MDNVAGLFKKKYEHFYTVHRRHRFYELNSMWINKWVMELAGTTIIVGAAAMVISGRIKIGTLTALISLYKKNARGCIQLNDSLIKMQRAAVALEAICRVLNFPIKSECYMERSEHDLANALVAVKPSGSGNGGEDGQPRRRKNSRSGSSGSGSGSGSSSSGSGGSSSDSGNPATLSGSRFSPIINGPPSPFSANRVAPLGSPAAKDDNGTRVGSAVASAGGNGDRVEDLESGTRAGTTTGTAAGTGAKTDGTGGAAGAAGAGELTLACLRSGSGSTVVRRFSQAAVGTRPTVEHDTRARFSSHNLQHAELSGVGHCFFQLQEFEKLSVHEALYPHKVSG